MRLRQVALVARDLEPVVDDLCQVLGLEVGYRDPGVAAFGLRNAVLPVGDTFLEVVSPERQDTAGARFLARRGGDGGYMAIFQTSDFAALEAHRKRLAELGIRVVWEIAFDDIATLHLHPRDVGGAIVSLDAASPPESWRWAGPDWQERRGRGDALALASITLASADPSTLAQRWAEVLGCPLADPPGGGPLEIVLDAGRVFVVKGAKRDPEGIRSIGVQVRDSEPILAAAQARGLPTGSGHVEIAGVRFELER